MTTERQYALILCLVESSVTLLHEWGEVLVGYLSPLLQRIAGGVKGAASRNEFRIGFISYSDPNVHPNPILAKRFFSPPFQLTKELKDDPASLGLGRTASGGQRGMAILEGYVAVLEMFDAVSDTRLPRSQPSNEGQPETLASEPLYHVIHIACSPPNNAKKPTWNMNPALDTVTWESLPSHLLKRKIRTSMILIRPISELQELFNNLSRTSEPFGHPMIRPGHKLLLSGIPPALKEKTVPQKRPAIDNPEAPPPPARPHPPEQTSPSAANATPSIAVKPRPASAAPSQTVAAQPQPPSQSQPQPPNLSGQNPDTAKLVGIIRALDADCRARLAAIGQAQAAGKSKAELDVMQSQLNQKLINRQKLVSLYQQYISKQQQPPGVSDSASAGQNLQQMNFGQLTGQAHARAVQEQFGAQVPQQRVAASAPGQDARTSPELMPSNNPFTALGITSIGKNVQNAPTAAHPGMESQVQKMHGERPRLPVLATPPQSQPHPPLQNQVQPPPGNQSVNLAAGHSNIVDVLTPRMNLGPHVRRWQGVLAWPSANAGGRKENQIAIAFYTQDANLRCDTWPQKLILQPSRTLFNMARIQAWNKESNPVMGLISHTPIPGNLEATVQNKRLFLQLRELINGKNLLAYCKFDIAGGPPGTGIVAFPANFQTPNELLVAMVFNKTSLPAAVTALIPMQARPTEASDSSDGPGMQRTISSSAAPPLQGMSPEAKAFLQQRQAVALAAYNQQQAALQQQQMVPNQSSGNTGPGSAFNVVQFLQNMQAGSENQMGVGGLAQAPGMQPTQLRQPSGFNPNLQMLQYLNRRSEEGQGQ